MKKAHKKILGVFGLGLVAAMTFAATQLPSPGAAAISEVTDTINVRVVGEVAEVKFTKPASGLTNIADQVIGISYENAQSASLTLKYTDADGNETTTVLWEDNTLDYNAGTAEIPLNLDEAEYGYGRYYFTLSGIDVSGVASSVANLLVEYVPTTADFTGKDGDLVIDLDYDEDKVSYVTIDVYVDGVKVDQIKVDSPQKQVIVKADTVDSWGEGKYTFVITTYDKNNQKIYETIYEKSEIPNTGTGGSGAPNTGGLFQNLNISKEDYLITGLLIFFVFAIVAFGVVARSHKAKSSAKDRK